jgi:tripartite ATP-independent transporter DctM subunit
MFGGVIVLVITGLPLGIGIGAVTLLVGWMTLGFDVTAQIIYAQTYDMMQGYVLLALPLFVFMGLMLENSGIVERLYSVMYVAMGRFRGGLAVVSVIIGTIMAACVGIIAASVTLLTLVALPSMVKKGYNKSLAAGTCAAAGTLGILIPPSILLVLLGPMAQISVGRLFMGAFGPGFLLSALYIIYIVVRCLINKNVGPAFSGENAEQIPLGKKLRMVAGAILPPAVLILGVLGSIFLGIAPPTEAAAIGALLATVLAAVYGKLSWATIKKTAIETARISAFAMLIGVTSYAFTAVFMRLGCGDVIANLILSLPFGKWGAFALIMFVFFLLGFFVDWIGIVFIMAPILMPLIPKLGIDPLWFWIMIAINLQLSFLTPPVAFAIYFVQGSAPKELGVTTRDIIRGVVPYIPLIMLAMGLCVAFPEIITWLPSKMIHGFRP